MSKNNPSPNPSVSLDEIRGIISHLPADAVLDSAMHRPAFLVFVHDLKNETNAAGQSFLAHNNNFDTRATQPLAVAAEMCRADYKIFDLSPPDQQNLPTSPHDVALAISYGMVTVEQGVDHIALYAVGQDSDTIATIATLDDVARTGALNIAACYGVAIAAKMAGVSLTLPRTLADCLTRIAGDEGWTAQFNTLDIETLKDMALELIQIKARYLIV